MTSGHAPARPPVLVDRVIETLAPASGETVLDCTVGLGGHAVAIAGRIGPTGTLVARRRRRQSRSAAALSHHLPPQLVPLHELRRRSQELIEWPESDADLGFASRSTTPAGTVVLPDGPPTCAGSTGPVTAAQTRRAAVSLKKSSDFARSGTPPGRAKTDRSARQP